MTFIPTGQYGTAAVTVTVNPEDGTVGDFPSGLLCAFAKDTSHTSDQVRDVTERWVEDAVRDGRLTQVSKPSRSGLNFAGCNHRGQIIDVNIWVSERFGPSFAVHRPKGAALCNRSDLNA